MVSWPYDFSAAVTDRGGGLLRITTAADERYRGFVPYEDIDRGRKTLDESGAFSR